MFVFNNGEGLAIFSIDNSEQKLFCSKEKECSDIRCLCVFVFLFVKGGGGTLKDIVNKTGINGGWSEKVIAIKCQMVTSDHQMV